MCVGVCQTNLVMITYHVLVMLKKRKTKKKNRIFVMVKLVLTNLGKLMCNCMYRLGLFQTDVCGCCFSGLVEYLDSDDY